MGVIGFNFSKINCERKAVIQGQVTINHSANVKNVEIDELKLGTVTQKVLRIIFGFKAEYQPDLATVEFEGEVLWLESPETTAELEQLWKKEKKLSESVMGQVMYQIISKCNIQALFLSRELNLPPPIPIMPKAEPQQAKKTAKSK